MTRAAKAAACVAAFLTVSAWAFLHGAFNGANLAAIIALGFAIAALWLSLLAPPSQPPEQPSWSWTDREHHRGDGV